MNRKVFMFISIFLIFILIGCNNINDCKLKSSNLTQKELNLLKLIGEENQCKIYDYILNNRVKSVHLNFKTLNSKGEWNENGGVSSAISSKKGRIAISSLMDNGNLQISVENTDGVAKFKSNAEVYDNEKNMARAMAWNEECDLVCGKEIPLAIQTISNTSEIGVCMDDFYDTYKLKSYDIVNAVTVMFSEDNIN